MARCEKTLLGSDHGVAGVDVLQENTPGPQTTQTSSARQITMRSTAPWSLVVLLTLWSSLTGSSLPGSAIAAEPPDWENEQVFGRNKEPPCTAALVYPSADAAIAGDRDTNPWFQSLNGAWKFRWSPTPDQRPADFFQPDLT